MTHLKHFFAVAFLFFFFNNSVVQAANFIGSEVRYKQLDSLKYQVDYILYRNCGNSAIGPSSISAYASCPYSGLTRKLWVQLVSVTEIKSACDSLGVQCNPSNTTASGNGYERAVLRFMVDFSKAPYKIFLDSNCTKVRIAFDACCRRKDIQTGIGNEDMYNYAEINLTAGNSSAILTTPPLLFGCCNQPIEYNIGAIDTVDGDSLSYAFVAPLRFDTTKCTYTGNYDYNRPFQAYYPGTLKFPYVNPNTSPPIGIYLDSVNGNLIFTPTYCAEHTAFTIEVKEWRKNKSTGKMEVVGVVRRDMEFFVKQCPSNYAPTIIGKQQMDACEGQQLCFDITTQDRIMVPPPPLPKPKGDSVFISWNRGIPQASFSVTYDTTVPKAKFCWTPDSGTARNWPYTFMVFADDDNCGNLLRSTRLFEVYVQPKIPAYSVTVDSLACGTYAVTSSLSSTVSSRLNFQLSIAEINGGNSSARFKSSYKATSTRQTDTIIFTKNGSYELVYQAQCGAVLKDTITINTFPKMTMPSDRNACFNDGNLDLTAFDTVGYGGTWSCPKSPNLINSIGEFLIDSIQPKTSTRIVTIYYQIGSLAQCGFKDSMKISVHPLPNVRLQEVNLCQNLDTVDVVKDRVVLIPSGATLALGRQTWSCVDCGAYTPSNIIKDMGSGLPGAPQRYKLLVGPSVINLSGQPDTFIVALRFRNVFGCFNADTANVIVHPTPTLTYQNIPDLCWNAGQVNLNKVAGVNFGGGEWYGVPKRGYGNDSIVNAVIMDSMIDLDRIGSGKYKSDSTYLLEYRVVKDFCELKVEVPLFVRAVPTPTINRQMLRDLYGWNEPYPFCDLDNSLTLKAQNEGIWTSTDTNALVGSAFDPRKATEKNKIITIWNKKVANGCVGTDSVQVIVHPLPTLTISADTAITWYAASMSKRVKAEIQDATGVRWKALTGGSVANANSLETDWYFSSNKDSLTKKLIYAQTIESSLSVCPFVEEIMVLTVHPSPCMDIRMTFDVSTKKLQLAPSNETLPYYRWVVNGQKSNALKPSFDLSGAKDSIILVQLNAFNRLGDSCYSYNKINVNNGSVKDLINDIQLCPNPVTTGFVISSSLNLDGRLLQIYASNGVLVYSKVINDSYVDCSSLADGIYTVVIEGEDHTLSTRILKE